MIHAKEFRKIKEKLNQILAKHTGQTLEQIEEDTDRDHFMSAAGSPGIPPHRPGDLEDGRELTLQPLSVG